MVFVFFFGCFLYLFLFWCFFCCFLAKLLLVVLFTGFIGVLYLGGFSVFFVVVSRDFFWPLLKVVVFFSCFFFNMFSGLLKQILVLERLFGGCLEKRKDL